MLKLLGAFAAVAFSAIVAGAITGYPGFAEPVSAQAAIEMAQPIAAPGCPNRGWPYQQCGQIGNGKTIRVIPIDRLN